MYKIDLDNIEAIIFDLGGVIIDVDMEAPYHKLLNLSNKNKDNLLVEFKNIAYQYEIGLIDNQKFINQIKDISNLNLTLKEVENLWNEMLGDVPNYMGDLLAKVKQKKRTFILSNTNPIHIKEVRRRFHQVVNDYQFESLFEKIYYSYEINLHKPDIQIFDYVVKDSNLNVEKTLFIDDNENNILSARKYGLKTCYLNPKMNLPQLFNNNEIT